MLKYIITIVAGCVLGWNAKGIYLEIQELTCNDYNTRHATWRGFLSTKGGDIRCFWLEDKYPWRVRQGVAE